MATPSDLGFALSCRLIRSTTKTPEIRMQLRSDYIEVNKARVRRTPKRLLHGTPPTRNTATRKPP